MALGVNIDFTANMVKLSSSLDKATAKLDQFQRKTQTISKSVESALGKIGVGLSVAGLTAFVKSGIDAADALNDMADRTGIAVDKLAGFQLATKLADTDMESFAAGVNKLSVNIGKAVDEFAALGITAKDPAEAFFQLADVFSQIEDPQQRAAVGAKALGKSWAELAPLLMQGGNALREQVKQGQEVAGITKEAATAAAEFNDKLDALATASQGFVMKFALGVLEPISKLGIEIDKAMAKGPAFMAFLNGMANGYKEFSLSETGGGMSKELDDINRKIAEQKILLQEARQGNANDGSQGGITRAVATQERHLNELLKQRVDIMKTLNAQRTQPAEKPAGPDQTAINKFIGNSSENDAKTSAARSSSARATSALASAETARAKSIQDVITSLQQDIALSRLSDDQQRRSLELINSLKDARGGEVQTITDLVNAKNDALEADKRQNAQWQQLIDDANAYYDLQQQIAEFGRTDASLGGMEQQLKSVQDLLASGAINTEQAKKSFDEIGRAFNENFVDKATESTNSLSLYVDQAARNMQSAFADFLFDPFSKGTQGMLDSFLNVIRRMAAEAASASLMDALFGKTSASKSGGDSTGGLINAVISGIAGAAFANGGVMTSKGPVPLNFYSSGGVANKPQLAVFGEGRMNEAFVPLPDGKTIPVTISGAVSGGVGNVQIATSVSVSGGSNNDNSNMQKLGSMINAKVREVIVTEKRPGGLLA